MESLVNDMTSTTSSYQQIQERESRLTADLNLAQAQLFPLRKDNTRLTRENHQLHIDSIKQKDESAVAVDDQKREIKMLEDKLNEMKYVMVANEKEMRVMEKEKERMREVSNKIILFHSPTIPFDPPPPPLNSNFSDAFVITLILYYYKYVFNRIPPNYLVNLST